MAVSVPIAAAVAGSATSSLLSGGAGGGGGATQVTTPQAPDWLQQGWQDLVTQAQGINAQPFTPYTGQAVAPLSGDESTAFQSLRDLMGSSNGAFQGAQNTLSDVMGRAINGPTASQVQGLMNPYTQDVLQQQNLLTMQNYDRQMGSLKSQAANAGAFGGSGDYLQRTMAQKNLGQQLSMNNVTGLSNAYNQAMGQFNTNTQTMGQTAFGQANLASQQQNLNTAGASALAGAGATQRGIGQQQNTFDYNEFMRQQGYPMQQANFLSNILAQSSPTFTGSSTQLQQNPNQLNSLMGGALAGGSLGSSIYNQGQQNGWWGNNGGNILSSYGGYSGNVLTGAPSNYWSPQTFNPSGYQDITAYKKGGLIKTHVPKNSLSKAVGTTSDFANPHTLIHSVRGIEAANRLEGALKTATGVNDTNSHKLQEYAKGGLLGYAGGGSVSALQRLWNMFGSPQNDLRSALTGDTTGSGFLDSIKYGDKLKAMANPSASGDGSGNWWQETASRDTMDPVEASRQAVLRQQGLTGISPSQRSDLGGTDSTLPPDLSADSGVSPDVMNDNASLAEVLGNPNPSSTAQVAPSVQPVGSKDSSSILNDLINTAIQQKVTEASQPKTFAEEANTPLLAMGLSMMASNSPSFGGALNEGYKAFSQTTKEQDAVKDQKLQDLLNLAEAQRKTTSQGIEDTLRQAQTKEALARAQTAGGFKPLSPNQKMASYTRFLAPKTAIIEKQLANGMISTDEANNARVLARQEADKDYAQAMIQAGYDPTPPGKEGSAVAPPAIGANPLGQDEVILAKARAAISSGAPRDKVIQRLQANGIDTSKL